jgi:hypothetical protein
MPQIREHDHAIIWKHGNPRNGGRRSRRRRLPVRRTRRWREHRRWSLTGAAELSRRWVFRSISWAPLNSAAGKGETGRSRRLWWARFVPLLPSLCHRRRRCRSREREDCLHRLVSIGDLFHGVRVVFFFSCENDGDRREIGRGGIPAGFNRTYHRKIPGLNPHESDPSCQTGIRARSRPGWEQPNKAYMGRHRERIRLGHLLDKSDQNTSKKIYLAPRFPTDTSWKGKTKLRD